MASTAKARPRSTAPSCPSPSILARARHAAAPPAVADVLGRPGRPLAPETRASMEPRFGRDFSHVRVHDDAIAGASARAMSTRAYSAGPSIVVDPSRVREGTNDGRHVLAHELTHVAQQPTRSTPAVSELVLHEHPAREAEADAMASAVSRGQPPAPAVHQAEPGAIQRFGEDPAPALSGAASGATGGGTSAPCVEKVVGEDPTTLTEAGTVTFIEFGATWCNPCKLLLASFEAMCQGFAAKPPKAPVRVFSFDVDEPGNEEIAKRYAPMPVPHLYIYVGNKERDHYNTAIQPDVIDAIVAEYTDEVSQSPAWKGAKKGGFWGGLAGLGLGIAGAIAVGTSSGLEGNALMAGILGSIAGGTAAGIAVGGGIGAIAGAVTADKKGSRRKKKKKMPLRRSGATTDPEEREADTLAARALERRVGSSARTSTSLSPGTGGAPIETALRFDMESRFGRDFSQVRLHRGAGGRHVADSMNAYAVTEGADIYFAPDGYAPETPAGRAILAHELAHVAQQDTAAPSAASASLEGEASRAAAHVTGGGHVSIQQSAGDDAPPLPLTRGKKTLLGGAIGVVGGAAAGALIGLGVAALMKDSPYGLGAAIGAVIGGVVGSIAGLIIGYRARRTDRVGAQEADMLIRRRYGRYMPGGVPAPLRDALIRPLSSTELCERVRCRRPDASCNLIGWTDTGVPWRGGSPPTDTIDSPADEPVCNGKQMEHATPERPVIYFQRDTTDAGILVHEGLHAISHPSFQGLHNFVNEGATELYTRRLLDEVNIAATSGYDDNVREVTKFERLVGEEPLARAYFAGDLGGLDRATAAIFGPCSLEKWAFALQMNNGESREADAVLAGRGIDYCSGGTSVFSAAAPAVPGDDGGNSAHRAGGGASGGGTT
jgi:thiol-disulfide isomerase/thioredoxin